MLVLQQAAAVAAATAPGLRFPSVAASSAAVLVSTVPRTSPSSATEFYPTAKPLFFSVFPKVFISSPSAATSIAIAAFVTAAAAVAFAVPAPALTRAQQSPPFPRVAATVGIFSKRQNAESTLVGLSKLKKRESAGCGISESAVRLPCAIQGRAFVAGSSYVVCAFSKVEDQVGECKRAQFVIPSCTRVDTQVNWSYTSTAKSTSGKRTSVKLVCLGWKKIRNRAPLLFPLRFFPPTAPTCHSSHIPQGILWHPALLRAIRSHFHGVGSPIRRRSYHEDDAFYPRSCVFCVACQFYFSSFHSSLPLVVATFRPHVRPHSWRVTHRSPLSLCSFVEFPRFYSRLPTSFPATAHLRPSLPIASGGIVRTSPFDSDTYSHNCSGGSHFSSRRLTQVSSLYHAWRPHNPCESNCKARDVELHGSTARFSAGGCCRTPSGSTRGGNNSSNTPDACRSVDSSDTDWWFVSRGSRRPHSPSRNNTVKWTISRHSSRRSSRHSSCGVSGVPIRRQQHSRLLQSAAVLSCVSGGDSAPATSLLFSVRTRGEKKPLGRRSSCQLSTFVSTSSDRMAVSHAGAEGAGQEEIVLQLEPQEQQLFDMLMQCVREEKLDVVLRAAGGWVRDKLLHRHSDDIDIAIDKMTGVEFAEALNRWLVRRGLPSHSIGVVASNPEQSKHLETATCRLLGRFQVDFVHLRTETYSEGSRIPEAVTFGAPAEDASRRDFTINALFYNLETRQVEDFVGTGLQDLQNGLLRAPLPDAEATLLDDPLRILRAVRFASRFGFALHADLIRAAQLDKVREALLSKVSRERVGIELKKMISGPLLGQRAANTREDTRSGSTKPPTEASSRDSESWGATSHTGVNGDTSLSQTSRNRTTTETEKLRGDANGGETTCTNSGRRTSDTSQAKAEDETCVEFIPAAARCVREALVLLVRLRVVSCVFKLPERVFAQPVSAGGEVFPKRPVHEHRQLVPCERDSQFKNWWVRGLGCISALTTLLEHYFEGAVRNAVEAGTDENTRRESPVDLQFRKLMEEEKVRFRTDFSDSHFRALMLGAFLIPTAGRFCLNGRSKPEKLLNFLVVESLKLSRKDADLIVLLTEGALAFLQELANDTEREMKRDDVGKTNFEADGQPEIRKDCTSQERTRLGLLVRNIGPSWRQALLIAAAVLQTEHGSPQGDKELTRETHLDVTASWGETVDDSGVHEIMLTIDRARTLKRARPHRAENVEDKGVSKEKERETAILAELAIQAARAPLQERRFAPVLRLRQKIKQAGLEEAWKLQPVYDGHAVKNVLPNLPKGPIFREVQEEQVRWQLANPSKTSQDCALHLKEMYKEFS